MASGKRELVTHTNRFYQAVHFSDINDTSVELRRKQCDYEAGFETGFKNHMEIYHIGEI